MPQGKKYTVKDSSTGKTITFQWNDVNPPTDADMEEVFRSAQDVQPQDMGNRYGQPIPSYGGRVIESMSGAGQTFGRGVQQARSGNIAAGGMNIASGILQAPFIPLNAINQTVKEIPFIGKPLSGAVESLVGVPSALAGGLAEAVRYATSGMGLQDNPQTFEAAKGLAQNIATILAPSFLREGVNRLNTKIGDVIENRPANLAERGIKNIQKGAPPLRGELNALEQYNRAKNYLSQIEREIPYDKNSPDSPARQSLNKTTEAKLKLYDERIGSAIDRHTDAQIKLDPLGEAIKTNVSQDIKANLLEPERVSAINSFADRLKGTLSLPKANELLTQLNAETKAYETANDVTKFRMRQENPTLDSQVNLKENLREAILEKLDSYGEADIAKFRKDYGAIKYVEDAIRRNVVPAENQGLGVGIPHTIKGGLLNIARLAVNYRGSKNQALKRGFEQLGRSGLEPAPVTAPSVTLRGLLPQRGSGGELGLPFQPEHLNLENKMTVTTGQFEQPIQSWQARTSFSQPSERPNIPLPQSLGIKNIVERAGMQYLGEQGGYVWFNDPQTGSTLMMRPQDVNPQSLMNHVQQSRNKFLGQ